MQKHNGLDRLLCLITFLSFDSELDQMNNF